MCSYFKFGCEGEILKSLVEMSEDKDLRSF